MGGGVGGAGGQPQNLQRAQGGQGGEDRGGIYGSVGGNPRQGAGDGLQTLDAAQAAARFGDAGAGAFGKGSRAGAGYGGAQDPACLDLGDGDVGYGGRIGREALG